MIDTLARLRSMLAMVAAAAVILPCIALTTIPHQDTQPDRAKAPGMHFVYVDISIDSAAAPLAAYQVEFAGLFPDGVDGAVQLVGVEGSGGTTGTAFSSPPAYDPAALALNRVIIADFSTAPAADLPRGKFRVARLHLSVENKSGAPATPEYMVQIMAAGAPDGTRIQATASVIEGEGR